MACILESAEIKKLWPVFNSSQKRREDVYGIFTYTDQNGYTRLAIEKNKQPLKPVYRFHNLVDGHAILRRLISEYSLCPKLCSLQNGIIECTGLSEKTCMGACEKKEIPESYNERVQQAIHSLTTQPSLVIVEDGHNPFEQACILVWNGKFYGMGSVPNDKDPADIMVLKDFIKPFKESSFTHNLVHNYASRFPYKVKPLSNEIILEPPVKLEAFGIQGSIF